MKVVIIGAGKVGYVLTEQLSRENHDVVVIDTNKKVLTQCENLFDVKAVCGNGACRSVQEEAEMPQADLMIAVTSTDECNILCCMVAKKLGAKHTIARVRNPEYTEQLRWMKDDLGLSMAVNPEFSAAQEVFKILRAPGAIKMESFAKGRVELSEIRLGEKSKLIGCTLSDLNKKIKHQILICAVQRKREVFIPNGSFILREGDKIHITASNEGMLSFFKKFGIAQQKVHIAIIIGGGKISYYLARMLIKIGVRVIIIEIDEKRCQKLNAMLPEAEIIFGDGAEQEILREEGIQYADALIALTDIDEENMIISMYAHEHGVPNVIAKINRRSFHELLVNAGVDSIISPKVITSAEIVRYVRAMQDSVGGKMETLYRLVDGKVEVMEFKVPERSDFIDVPIKELSIKKNVLLASIVRNGKAIIPSGDNIIESGDSVIVVTRGVQLLSLNDIFE